MNNKLRIELSTMFIRLLILGFFTVLAPAFAAENTFVIATPPGHYAETQNDVFLIPFAKEANLDIVIKDYHNDIHSLREQSQNDSVWDIVDMPYAVHLQACKEGLLLPINTARLLPAPDGTLAQEDFADGAIGRCGIAHAVTSSVIAFNPDHFPIEKPVQLKDLFDIDRFPGKRALPRKPFAILEWALLSYDVPRGDLYNLLSTERGLDLAFSRLQAIKPHVMWWQDEAEPVRWLAQGDVVMATAPNDRLFDAAFIDGEAIGVIWDGQIYDYRVWGIPKTANEPKRSMEFIRFASDTWRMADFASYIAYGPTRRSASNMVWTHFDTGVDMRPHMPNQPINFSNAVRMDHEWYASIGDQLNKRFETWLVNQEDE